MVRSGEPRVLLGRENMQKMVVQRERAVAPNREMALM